MSYGIDVRKLRRSIESRTALGQTVKAASTSPFVQAHPDVKAANDDVVKEAETLGDLDATVKSLESQLDVARKQRKDQAGLVDAAVKASDGVVRKHSTSNADVAAAGYPAQAEPVSHQVVAPELTAEFDPVTGAVTVTAHLPPGMKVCAIFKSTNPADPASWDRIKGITAERTLKGLPPGTYWFKAQCLRGDEESDFCVPVSAIVK